MNFQPQISQEDLAKFADDNGLPFEARWSRSTNFHSRSISAVKLIRDGYEIRLTPGALTEFGLKPGMKANVDWWKSPDELTEGGVYRAVEANQILPNEAQYYDTDDQDWLGGFVNTGDTASSFSVPIRVPVSTPFPKAYHIVEPTEMVSSATKESSSAQSDTPEERLDQLFLNAFGTNDAAMLDWVQIKFRLKELTAALSQRDEAISKWEQCIRDLGDFTQKRDGARRLLGEAKEKLAALVAASDGVSIEGIDLQDTCATLKQITEYLK